MPTFITKNGCHFVAYITGPSHVLLGVRLSSVPQVPKLTKQPPQGKPPFHPLDEAKIRTSTQEGFATVGEVMGTNLHLAEIIYVEDDTPHYQSFRIAAELLAGRIAARGEFTHVA